MKTVTSASKLKILELLEASPAGATDLEMQTVLAMGSSTQRPRRKELQMAGLIRDSGRRRLSRTGEKCVVWELGDGTPPPKTISKQKAVQPFVDKAIYLANTYPSARDGQPVNMIMTMGAIRALVRATQPPEKP